MTKCWKVVAQRPGVGARRMNFVAGYAMPLDISPRQRIKPRERPMLVCGKLGKQDWVVAEDKHGHGMFTVLEPEEMREVHFIPVRLFTDPEHAVATIPEEE